MMSQEIRNRIVALLRKVASKRSGDIETDKHILRDILLDAEWYEKFIEDVSKEFNVRIPDVTDMVEYKRRLRKMQGVHISDLFRSKPTMFVPDLTVNELVQVVEKGVWPESYLLPPE